MVIPLNDPVIKPLNDPRVVKSSGGGMCPEQHWGTLTDGSVFYYRMRFGWAQVHVGPPGTDEADLPLVNPAWNREEADAAYEAGRDYISFRLEPIGEVHAYPDDDLIGFFLTQEDRDRVFTACLDQIWKDGRVDYSPQEGKPT